MVDFQVIHWLMIVRLKLRSPQDSNSRSVFAAQCEQTTRPNQWSQRFTAGFSTAATPLMGFPRLNFLGILVQGTINPKAVSRRLFPINKQITIPLASYVTSRSYLSTHHAHPSAGNLDRRGGTSVACDPNQGNA